MAWKKKHNLVLRNKAKIIAKHNEGIPMKEIGREYGVNPTCIYKNLKSWGQIRSHGLKHILRKMFINICLI